MPIDKRTDGTEHLRAKTRYRASRGRLQTASRTWRKVALDATVKNIEIRGQMRSARFPLACPPPRATEKVADGEDDRCRHPPYTHPWANPPNSRGKNQALACRLRPTRRERHALRHAQNPMIVQAPWHELNIRSAPILFTSPSLTQTCDNAKREVF